MFVARGRRKVAHRRCAMSLPEGHEHRHIAPRWGAAPSAVCSTNIQLLTELEGMASHNVPNSRALRQQGNVYSIRRLLIQSPTIVGLRSENAFTRPLHPRAAFELPPAFSIVHREDSRSCGEPWAGTGPPWCVHIDASFRAWAYGPPTSNCLAGH